MKLHAKIEDAISIDEIGIATGRIGDIVLKSAFQMVYALRGEELRAVAAESFLRPFHHQQPVEISAILGGLDPVERGFIEQLAIALHIANHPNLDVSGLDHIVGLGHAALAQPGIVDLIQRRLANPHGFLDINDTDLLCTIREPLNEDALQIVKALKDEGFGIVLGSVKGTQPSPSALREVVPSIARIDGAWFKHIAGNEGAVRLLSHLVSDLRSLGVLVLVDCIEKREQLLAAIEVGADLFQGFLLSKPQLAGMPVSQEAVWKIAKFKPRNAQIIPLFRER